MGIWFLVREVKLYHSVNCFFSSVLLHTWSFILECLLCTTSLQGSHMKWTPLRRGSCMIFVFYLFLLIFIIQLINLCLSGTGYKWNMDFWIHFTVLPHLFCFPCSGCYWKCYLPTNTKNSCGTETESCCRYVVWKNCIPNLKLTILHTCKTLQWWKHDQLLCFSFCLI